MFNQRAVLAVSAALLAVISLAGCTPEQPEDKTDTNAVDEVYYNPVPTEEVVTYQPSTGIITKFERTSFVPKGEPITEVIYEAATQPPAGDIDTFYFENSTYYQIPAPGEKVDEPELEPWKLQMDTYLFEGSPFVGSVTIDGTVHAVETGIGWTLGADRPGQPDDEVSIAMVIDIYNKQMATSDISDAATMVTTFSNLLWLVFDVELKEAVQSGAISPVEYIVSKVTTVANPPIAEAAATGKSAWEVASPKGTIETADDYAYSNACVKHDIRAASDAYVILDAEVSVVLGISVNLSHHGASPSTIITDTAQPCRVLFAGEDDWGSNPTQGNWD